MSPPGGATQWEGREWTVESESRKGFGKNRCPEFKGGVKSYLLGGLRGFPEEVTSNPGCP